MKNSPHRRKHEQKKAIRSAQKEAFETDAKVPKEATVKKYTTSEKTAKINRGKVDPKHKHHQTSPKDVTWDTEPDSIHKEGKSWVKTLQKQTLNAASRLQKKIQKFKKKK